MSTVLAGACRTTDARAGTTVRQNGDGRDGYAVTPTGGRTLSAGGLDGGPSPAYGINGDGVVSSGDPGGEAESHLAFGDIAAAPIDFPDAATFR